VKFFLLAILFLVSGCYCHPRIALVSFIDANTVMVNGRKFDVSDKNRKFEVRKTINYAEEIDFSNVELSNCKFLWNMISFKWPHDDPTDIPAACYNFVLSDNQRVEVFFRPISSYFYHEDDFVCKSVSYDDNINEIDFGVPTNECSCSEMCLEIYCDEEKAKGTNIIPKIEKFAKTGTGRHVVCLPFY